MSLGRVQGVVDFQEEWIAQIALERQLDPFVERVRDARDWKERLNAIRAMYRKHEELGCGDYDYCDPYRFGIHDHFTPIERGLWSDIRSTGGVQMIPQYPVGPYVLDFASPSHKIGLEADGAPYHDQVKDRARDQRLWERYGWRVFRCTGAECKRVLPEPWEVDTSDLSREEADQLQRETARAFFQATSTGVVIALALVEFSPTGSHRWSDEMVLALDLHRLADFPIGVAR